MGDLTAIPAWLGTAIIGAIIAVLSFFAKTAYEWFDEIQDRRNMRRAKLVELISMLKAEFAISSAYQNMTVEEKELHTLVRSYTINSIRPLNLAVVEWIKNDNYFKISRKKHGLQREVSAMLAQLDAHLLMWEAKYKIWIPDRPDHALVYLADEKKHGIPFPSGIEEKLEQLLENS
jgi:hypothetical protein